MALTVSKVQVWVGEIEDKPGGLAGVLEPLAQAGVNLEYVLARRSPEEPGKGVVFAAPVVDSKARKAATAAGLSTAKDLAALRVEGANRAGVGHAMTSAIAGAGVSLRGLAATAIGNMCVCYLAFDSAADANKAARALRAMGAPKKRTAKKK